MKPFKASEPTLFFNTRDELVRVRLERVVNFVSYSKCLTLKKVDSKKELTI